MADATSPSPLKPGRPAPTFRLPSSTGETIDLRHVAAQSRVVLFFYPKADTPGCTKEACGFRDDRAAFARAGVTVLGISPDSPKAVRRFAEKFKLDFPLLADEDHAVADRYGLWQEKSLYGRKFMGVVRTTVVIARGGNILHVFERVKPDGHSRQVLEWLADRPDVG